jgi:hypothetical protein
MRLGSLADLLSGRLSGRAFALEVEEEMAAYRRGLRELGRSAPVVVIADEDVLVSLAGLKNLCRSCIAGELDLLELAYIGDAMLLSERVRFESPKVEAFAMEFSDPDVNGRFTPARAGEILRNTEP